MAEGTRCYVGERKRSSVRQFLYHLTHRGGSTVIDEDLSRNKNE